jgi:hypothetical protein
MPRKNVSPRRRRVKNFNLSSLQGGHDGLAEHVDKTLKRTRRAKDCGQEER